MSVSGLVRIFLRTLLVQGSLNFSRMQNLGFAFALLPWIREKGSRTGCVREMLLRHLQYFNTHPYFAAPIIGAVLHMEERDEDGPSEVGRLKEVLMGPYAAIGDVFFWGALKSLGSIAAFFPALIGMPLAPLILLTLYNPAHFAFRIAGFADGCRRGRMSVEFIRSLELPDLSRRIRRLTVVLLGTVAALAVSTVDMEWPELWRTTAGLAMLPAMLILFAAMKRGVPQLVFPYAMVGICCMISYGYV